MIDVTTGGDGDGEARRPGTIPSPARVLPLREAVAFPDTVLPLAVGQPRSVELVNDALANDRMVVLVASRDPELEEPPPDQLYDGRRRRRHRADDASAPDGTLRILVQTGQRVRIDRLGRARARTSSAEVAELPDTDDDESPELTALVRNVQPTFGQIVEALPYLPEELQVAVANVDDPGALSHLIAGSLRLKTEEKQALLEETRRRPAPAPDRRDPRRASSTSSRSARRIQSEVQGEIDRTQREFFLRQQLKAIQEELGERDPAEAEVDELREQLAEVDAARGDPHAGRPRALAPGAPAAGRRRARRHPRLAGVGRVAAVGRRRPRTTSTSPHAREVLEDDHFGLERVKDRILEFLAVRTPASRTRAAAILLFVGPPGVGKTSLGRSIATALGREFERISVGGVRDEAEIRGHRRTYIGAMPGVIVRAMRDAGSMNPLFMIDELDKMGADFRGDPASAMLEVLDPEQNSTFRDHYLDVPFDLSGVMFIATANTLDTIPGPLLDRMEIIQIAGYTEEEKLEIAKRYLVPRQIERHGLKRSQVDVHRPRRCASIIRDYTREAGVRNLEREIGTICRKVARQVAEGELDQAGQRLRAAGARAARPRALPLRGQAPHARARASRPAWRGRRSAATCCSSRSTRCPAPASSSITGQLGDVMKESAQAALSWVRGHVVPRDRGLVRRARHPHPRAGGRDRRRTGRAPA